MARISAVLLLAYAALANGQAEQPSECPSQAIPRLALVIGNERYRSPTIAFDAKGAEADAQLIAHRLCKLGFDTVVLTNIESGTISTLLTNLRNRSSLRYQEQNVHPIVVVYFAGHGFNVGGRGFIAGIDAVYDPKRPESIIDQSVALADVERELVDTALIVLLDSCRSDIISSKSAPPADATTTSSSSELMKLLQSPLIGNQPETTSQDRRYGRYLVGYAAYRVGDVAFSRTENSNSNGAYTSLLSRYLGAAADDIDSELTLVDQELPTISGQRQGSNREGHVGKINLLSSQAWRDDVTAKWNSRREGADPQMVRNYLLEYPDSPLAPDAAKWLTERGMPVYQ